MTEPPAAHIAHILQQQSM